MLLLILFFIIVLFTLTNIHSSYRRQLLLVFFFCLVSFALTGLRWNYGGDWDNYYDYFESIKDLDFRYTSFEFGWVILSYIVKVASNSYTLFQFLVAGFFFFCITSSIKKLSVLPLLSYLIYFATSNGGISYVRTVFATCIILYSLVFAEKKDIKRYLITWFLAFSIHFSSFIALPIFWIYNNSISYRKYFLVFIACASFFYLNGKMFLSDFGLLGPYVQYKLDKYISAQEAGEYFGGSMTIETAMINYIIKKSFVFIFLFTYCREALKQDSLFRGITNVYIAGTIFYCSVVPIAMQFGRMAGYMDGVEMFLVPLIYKYIQKSSNKLIFITSVIIMNFVRIKGHLDPNNPLIYDYHWILF